MNRAEQYNQTIKRMSQNFAAILPSEYQQVEYLASSGTQYIRSGVYNCDSIDTKFQVVSYTDSTLFVGAKSSTNNLLNRIGVGELLWQGRRLFIFMSDNGNWTAPEDLNVHTVQMGAVFDWKLYFDGVYKADFPNHNITNYEVYLFKSQVDAMLSKCKIFYAKIYAGGILARDYIPCYRISDNKPGMYDIVTQTFYTNAGTGDFTMGINV